MASPDEAWTWTSFGLRVLPVLIGGLVSAGFAYLIARRASVLADRGAFAKAVGALLQIVAEVGQLRAHLADELIKYQNHPSDEKEPWWFVLEMSGMTSGDVPEFDPQSLAVILVNRDFELVQDMILLQRRCVASHAAFRDYCQRRAEIRGRMPAPKIDTDGAVHALVSHDEKLALLPYTAPMNDIIVNLIVGIEKDWELAKNVLEKFSPVAQKLLKNRKFRFEIEPDADGPGPSLTGPPT